MRSFRFDSDDGMWPVKLLYWSVILVTFVRFPRDTGIDPVKLKLVGYKISKLWQVFIGL